MLLASKAYALALVYALTTYSTIRLAGEVLGGNEAGSNKDESELHICRVDGNGILKALEDKSATMMRK
jgi:hypothetical protein